MALTSKPLTSGSPIQLHRTLDRVLDEAVNTGALVLSGQKLKEYPTSIGDFRRLSTTSSSSVNDVGVDLSDIQSVDLSSNRLTEIPSSLCQCVRLESADFSGNVVRNVPTEIAALKFLRVLTLDRNLIFTLPPHLCRLRQLQILSVRSNKLVSIPDEISSLDQLQELDLSCNELDRLPTGIFGLVNLRRLNVRRNNLIELPEVPSLDGAGRSAASVSFLAASASTSGDGPFSSSPSRLVSLDVSSNRIQRLPLSLRHLKGTLQSLVLDHNPLDLPPAHVCKKGRLHVFKCLEKEFFKEKNKVEVIHSLYQPSTATTSNVTNNTKHVTKSNSFGSALNGSKSYKMPSVQERFQKQQMQLQQQQRDSSKNNQSNNKKPRSHTVANGNVFKEAAEQHRLLQQQQHPPQQQQPQPHLAPHQKAGTRDSGYHGAMDAESCWPGVSSISTTPSSSSPDGEEDLASPTSSWTGGANSNQVSPRATEFMNLQRSLSSSAATSTPPALLDHQIGDHLGNNHNQSGGNSNNASNTGGMNSSGTLTPASPNTVTPPAVRHYINPSDGISPPRLGGNPFEGYSPPRDTVASFEDEFNKVMNKKLPMSTTSLVRGISTEDDKMTKSKKGGSPFSSASYHSPQQQQQHQPSLSPSTPSSVAVTDDILRGGGNNHNPCVSSVMASPMLNLDGSYQSTLPSTSSPLQQQQQHNVYAADSPYDAAASAAGDSPADRMEREKTVVRIPIAEMAKPVLPPSVSSSTLSRSSPNKGSGGLKKNATSAGKTASSSPSYSTASLTRTAKTGSPARDSPTASFKSTRSAKASSSATAIGSGGTSSKPSSRIPAFSSSSSSLANGTPKGQPTTTTSSKAAAISSCSPVNDDKNNNKDSFSSQNHHQRHNSSPSRSTSYRSTASLPVNATSSSSTPLSSIIGDKESSPSFGGGSPNAANFTIRREEQRLREDVQIVRNMRSHLESRLKIQLPDSPPELSKALSDGVILCHLMNHLRPRTVPTIHVPSATTPKLTYAKCARNVENFLEACRKLGVARDDLCAQNVVLEGKSAASVARTVDSLLRCVASASSSSSSSSSGRRMNGSSTSASGGGGSAAARVISRGYTTGSSPSSVSARDLESDLTTVTQV